MFGAYSIYQCGLVDKLSTEISETVVKNVLNERERSRRLRQIGFWTLQSITKSIVHLWEVSRGTKLFNAFWEYHQ